MMIEKTLRWIVLGGIFILPLIVFIVATSYFFPFVTGKNFAFRIIVEIITGSWVTLALIKPEYRPRRSWLLGVFALFVLVIALADALGVNPFKSFWSNFERMDGWITLAHLFAYFVVVLSMLSTEKLWRAFLNTSLGVSVVLGFHALLQLFGVVSLNPGFSSAARLDATFGNPIYLAAHMLFHVFIATLLLAQDWQKKGRLNTVSTWLYGSVALFDTFILCFTGTRGTMLGLAGGIILVALLFILFSKGRKLVRQIAIGSIIAVMVLGGGIYLVRNQSWVTHTPVLGRLASISVSDATVQSRFMNWGMAWEGFKERPILGWGQENYAIVFSKYYNPNMYAQEQWFDRVHNVVFDWLVAGGILGLLSYLSLFGAALLMLWRQKRDMGNSFTLAEQSILTGLLAAYFFHNLFVFDNIMSYLMFVTVLAYIAWRAGVRENAKLLLSNMQISKALLPLVAALMIAIIWGATWYLNARPIALNKTLLQALSQQSEGAGKNLEYFRKALSYHTIGSQEVREHLMQTAASAASTDLPNDVKEEFLVLAANGLKEQSKESPLDPRFPLFLGVLLDTYGAYAQATPVLEHAHELSPTKQTILFELASNAYAQNNTEKTLDYFRQAYELAPDFTTARILYAAVAIYEGRDSLADELLAPIIPTGEAADARITSAYVVRQQYDKLITIWNAHITAQPADTQGYFTLAAVYYKAGRPNDAIRILNEASKVDPTVESQVKTLIEEVRNGTIEL